MNNITTFFSKLKTNLLHATKRYLLTIILFMISSILLIIAISISENNDTNINNLIRLTLTFIFGGFISLTIKQILERINSENKNYNLLYILIPGLMSIIHFILLKDINNELNIFKYFILIISSILLFIYIPFFKNKQDSSYYTYKIFIHTLITIVYFGIITAGIESILFAIISLFNLDISASIYLKAFVFISGFIVPALFVSGIPTKIEQGEYANLIKKLLIYVIFVILTIYTIILYAYFIKILIEFTLPSNLLGNLVIYYAFISIIILYFGIKLKDTNKWCNLFIKIYPYFLILPVLMMTLSFGIRINNYGITELRYFALLIIIFSLRSISILKLRKQVKLIIPTIIILLLISTFGPLSANNISRISQTNRLTKILQDNNMLKDTNVIPNSNISEEEQNEISEILYYIYYNHDIEKIEFLPENFEFSNMEEIFGFEYNRYNYYDYKRDEYYTIKTTNDNNYIDVSNYDYIINEIYSLDEKINIEEKEIEIILDDNLLTIYVKDKIVYNIDIKSYLDKYFTEENKNKTLEESIIIKNDNNNVSIQLIINHVYYNKTDSYLDFNGNLLIGITD